MSHLPNILIVDDTIENLNYLEAVLSKIKVNLIQAASGYDALKKTKDIELALAIIDVMMPEMDGYELAVKLNEERSGEKVPIIFITAYHHNEEQVFKGYKAGAVDYITKPISNIILLSKTNIFLDLFNQKQKILKDAAELKKLAEKLAAANSALQMSEQKYRNYIENAPDGVFIADETGRYVEVNDAACRITGYEKSELLKMTIKDILPVESLDEGLANFKRVVQTGKSTSDLPFIHRNGSKRWWTIDAVKLNDTRFLGFTKDITARKQIEEVLIESQSSLENAQQIAHIGSWDWDMLSNTAKWSKELFRIFDIKPDTYDGKPESLLKVIHSEDVERFIQSMNSTISNGVSSPLEYRVIHRDGSVHNIFAQGRIELNKSGKPVRSVGTAQDITKMKTVEEELKNSLEQLHQLTKHIEKVRENERMAISRDLHDELGQALTAVKIDLGIIKQQVSDAAVVLKINDVSALVGETIKTVQRLTAELRPQIIDDLGLEAAIEWYTKEFAQRNGIEVFLDMDSGITISSDVSLNLFRIMQESLTNITRHSRATQVDIGLNKKDDLIVFWISDNGIGIKENEIKSKNSFGIISMKERASSLGGTLDFCLDNDRGTLVKLLLPIKNE